MGGVWKVVVVGWTFKTPFPFSYVSLILMVKVGYELSEEAEWGKKCRWETHVVTKVRITPLRGKYLTRAGFLGSSLGYHEPRRNH